MLLLRKTSRDGRATSAVSTNGARVLTARVRG
jgi:hypothetical protein